MSNSDARQIVLDILHAHRENFARFTWCLPQSARNDLYTLYAFCRTADDAADSPGTPDERIQRLDSIQQALDDALTGRNAVSFYPAVAELIHRRNLPLDEFKKLLDAFRWDQTHTDWESIAQLEQYCTGSANPVGRLVLLIFYDETTAKKYFPASDYICTALQLVNLWQDVQRDFDAGRIYLPKDLRERYGVTRAMLQNRIVSDGYRNLIRELCDDTEQRFREGRRGFRDLNGINGFTIDWFAACGLRLIKKIRALNYNTLDTRPTLGKWDRVTAAFTSMTLRRRA